MCVLNAFRHLRILNLKLLNRAKDFLYVLNAFRHLRILNLINLITEALIRLSAQRLPAFKDIESRTPRFSWIRIGVLNAFRHLRILNWSRG